MSKFNHLSEEKIRNKIKQIDDKSTTAKDKLRELANEGKRLKLTLNQKELAKERQIIAKLKELVGGVFIGSTAIDNIEKCIAKMTNEKDRKLVIENIYKLRADYKKKEV